MRTWVFEVLGAKGTSRGHDEAAIAPCVSKTRAIFFLAGKGFSL